MPAGTPRIVQEHALLRRLIGVAHEIAEIGYELPVDVAGALDQAEAMVFDVAQRRSSDSVRSLKDLLTESLERLDHLYDRGETITGVPTGYGELDHLLSGLQPSNLVVVGARPSMGKTAFALGLATHAASNHGVPVLFFSLEMSHLEIAQRVLAAEARLDVTKLRNGRLLDSDWPKISSAIGRIDTAPLFIDDNPNVTIMDIRAKARRMRSSDSIGLVVIDYLQLMTGRSSAENRQVEISEISRGLKILARELQLPVVALSQLSRGLEARADKRPMLADLRECLSGETSIARADTNTPTTIGKLALLERAQRPRLVARRGPGARAVRDGRCLVDRCEAGVENPLRIGSRGSCDVEPPLLDARRLDAGGGARRWAQGCHRTLRSSEPGRVVGPDHRHRRRRRVGGLRRIRAGYAQLSC